MSDLRERFIELAIRPLAGKSPAEDLARGELMERLNHARSGPQDESLEVAIAQLEATSALSRKTGVPAFCLLLAFAIVIGLVSLATWRDLVRMDRLYNVIPGRIDHVAAAERELERKVPEDQRIFLFSGHSSMGTEIQRAWHESCKVSLPDDPAWLEEYAFSAGLSVLEGGQVFLHARRIDPGNGMWDAREATGSLVRSKFKHSSSRPRGAIGPALPVLKTDQPYREAVDHMERASVAPRFESWIPPRTIKRLAMLGPATDLAELADRWMFAGVQWRSGSTFHRWAELWEARAAELERDQDREGLRRWFGTIERLLPRCLADSGNKRLYDPGGFFGSRHSRNFLEILRRQELHDEAARLDHWIRESSRPLTGVTSGSGMDIRPRMAVADYGDWIHAIPGSIQDRDLEPGRRAEHAAADRMLAVTVAILFGVLACLACLEGWRRARPVRGLADRVGALLRPSDFAWIFGLGIAVPALWHVAIAGISPLGARDFSITCGYMKPVALRVAGSFLFACCMLIQSARWRLAKRGGVLGFRPVLWPGWAMAIIAALFVPAISAVRYLPTYHPRWQQDDFVNFGSAVAGLPLLWLLWRSFAMVLCPTRAALPGVLVCRMLMPCFIGAALLLLASAPLLKREESKWVQRDALAHPDPGGSGLSVMDARLVEMLRDKLLHAIETAPQHK
ncbi:hypothetical protein OKA05_16850 [Luteolibacter arcticus]|uniref:Uncharacterized protein n=1 Tax=Luteolibacter arcticus TaxID=1581411 RepID=A0ABT3GL56_9BACT|nr:hypothetical protein [Luteolibacter arcticus]MCW1924238.1 hypothetical protein [Luteolibacter arcticus]